MNRARSHFEFPLFSSIALTAVLAFATFAAIGCGGGGNNVTTTQTSGSTAVTVLASSTANGQLFQFSVTLSGLTLVNQSGKAVPVLTSPVGDDFMHLNGSVEPLATATIPQGTYTSATATITSAYPACAGQTGGTLLMDEALNGPGALKATVNMPKPITVTGTAMGLILDLQVSQSAPFSGGCSQSLTNAVPVAPVFNLTPVVIANAPSNITNGKFTGLQGVIGSVDASGTGLSVNSMYTDNANNPPSWHVTISGSTVVQGAGSASGLAIGTPVDMDLALQPDGSLLATRISVLDADPANLSIFTGTPLQTISQPPSPTYPQVTSLVVEEQGDVVSALLSGFDFDNATFQISKQVSNLQNLPFAAAFNEANLVDGQNISVTTHAQRVNGFAPTAPPAATITLMPQTLNGTVSAISTSGAFMTYTIALAHYDLFPNLAVQTGQQTLLTNPGTVVVYADGSTQNLNSTPATVGSTLRFRGLVFNDNGTLRMDCMQIQDGVAE